MFILLLLFLSGLKSQGV